MSGTPASPRGTSVTMSLSTSIASSRGPRKHNGPNPNPKPHSHSHQGSGSSGGRKQQSSNSEEEIAQRQQRSRQNATKSTCCLISVVGSTSLPVLANFTLVSVAAVCLIMLQGIAAT